MSELADLYLLQLEIDGPPVKDLVLLMLEELSMPPWPPVSSWVSPPEDNDRWRSDSITSALASTEQPPDQAIEWKHDGMGSFGVRRLPDRVSVNGRLVPKKRSDVKKILVAIRKLIAFLLGRNVWIISGNLERVGGGYCLPRHAIFGGPSHIGVSDRERLAWSFEQPDEVIAQGGWEAEEVNEFFLLTRAMDAVTAAEMLEEIQDGQWAMARSAKPGMKLYDDIGAPLDEEEEIFHEGEPRVLPDTYDAKKQVGYFSCSLEPDEHVHGWEVLALREMLRSKKLPNGKAVTEIDVVFPDEESARREARPLLDVGVRVRYDGAGGEREELT